MAVNINAQIHNHLPILVNLTFICFNVAMLTEPDLKQVRQIVKEEVKEQLTTFRSDMITKLDKILKVTTTTAENITVLSQHSADHTDQLETHQKKLKIIESKLNIASN
jgi:hypothetical protein